MKLTGAEIIVKCLIEQGVDTIFGYPGGAVLNIYDALSNTKRRSGTFSLRMNKVRHMQLMDMLEQLVRLEYA